MERFKLNRLVEQEAREKEEKTLERRALVFRNKRLTAEAFAHFKVQT